MKFGKTLIRNQKPEWSSYYINYKQLKQLIKQIDHERLNREEGDQQVSEADTARFFYLLDRNAEVVDKFFNQKYREYLRRLRHVTDRYPPTGNPQDLDKEELEDLIGVLLEVRGQLRVLQWYADINKRGFVKILKKFDKRMGSHTQSNYLTSKIFILPFANGATFENKLSLTNRYLSELTPFAAGNDQDDNKKSTTEKIMDDLRLQRVPSNSSTSSVTYTDNIKAAITNDDVEAFEMLVGDPTQRALLSFLSKALHAKSFKCVEFLIKRIDTLEDSEELNGRNILHRLVINQGRQILEESGKQNRYINPAEPPRQPSKLHQGMEEDGGSQTEDLYETMTHLLSLLNPKQRLALVATDQHNRTPLHHSAYYGLRQMTQLILDHMKKWGMLGDNDLDNDNWIDNEYETPIRLAIANNHPKTAAVILGYSQKLDPKSPLLSIATMHGNVECMKVLLDNGLDINNVMNDETALFIASKMNYVNAAQFLLERGADTEIAEPTYGWTPVFVAAVDGYEDIVKALIAANCNIERVDGSGWTAMEHACLRGHLELAEILRPKIVGIQEQPFSGDSTVNLATDNKKSTKPPSGATIKSSKEIYSTGSTPNRVQSPTSGNNGADAIKTFGHRYLQDKAMVLVTLGTTDRRDTNPVLDLDRVPYSRAHSTQLDTALSLVVSGTFCEGEPCVIDLPLSDGHPTEPIAFYVDPEKLDEVRLYFDLVPTYAGTTKKIFGRAVALLKNIYTSLGKQKRSLHQTLTAPIIESETLEVLGHIKFGFLVVTPFEHPSMGIEKSATYWKSLITTRVIGHRGLGKNSTSKKSLQLGENTLESFIQAANLGASYVEFDVQLTKDHVPVIYHDFLVAETGIDIPMHALTLEQFINVSELRSSKGGDGWTGNRDLRRKVEFSSEAAQKEKMQEMLNQRPRSMSVYQFDDENEYEEMQKRMKFTRDYKLKGFKGNSRGHSIQQPFTTLADVFKSTPKQVGFNIECKYPMLDESEAEEMETLAIELNHWVDTVLKCVYDNSDGRDIIFSSFNPDICLMLAIKQPSIPVLFLTEGGAEYMADVRASSLQEAIRFAKRWQLLGIVSAARPLIQCPRLVNVIKESGLVCVSYGTDNNEPENARLQMKSGVDAVIVDSVLAIRKELTSSDE